MTPLQQVWLTLALMVAPLGLLAVSLQIYPRWPLVRVGVVGAAASVLVLAREDLFWLVAALDALLLAMVTADLLLLAQRQGGLFRCPLVARRVAPRVASLGKKARVTIELENHRNGPMRADLRDDVDEYLHASPDLFHDVTIPPRSKVSLQYTIRPTRRGAFRFERIHVSARSRLGFWRCLSGVPCETTIKVYPDLKQLSEYSLLARKNQLSQMGVRRIRRVGQDHDFERLRDYTLDDNYKHMDWRATARRQKLTVKDFQSSRSQRVIFLVDCGRMMTNEAGGISLLDHAINAMLMLGYVALQQGDAVGLITFSHQVHSFVPPRAGLNQMTRLLHACFDRFPSVVESRYDEVFRYLATRCRKRSLVVLITNVVDEVNAGQVQRYMTNLVGRHLPLGVLLRDRRLFEAVVAAPRTETETYRAAAAAEILLWRLQILTDLQNQGALALDVLPEEITASLVNEYLHVKARHLL